MDPDYLVRVIGNSIINHLQPSTNPDDLAYAQDLLVVLLEKCASKDYNTIVKKNVFPNTLLHRQKCRLLQSCTLLWALLLEVDHVDQGVVGSVHDLLWQNIAQESMPSTRCYFEWMLARGYSRDLFSTAALLERVKNYHGSAAMSISVLTIAYLVAARRDAFKTDFLDCALPYFIHNNHAVRMFIIYIWERLTVSIATGTDNQLPNSYKTLSNFIRTSEHCQKFMEKLKDEHMLKDFDLDGDVNLQFVFAELPRRLGMAVDEFIAYPSFLAVDESCGRIPVSGGDVGRVYVAITGGVEEAVSETVTGTSDQNTTQTRFQQKMVPVELAEAEQELQGIKRSEALLEKTRAGRIIILASYVDKVPNLAGLARTCEVLGAATLCVPSASLLNSTDFQAVCMTADRWLDIIEVRPDQVTDYLNRMRTDGFRIVAIEQSSSSVTLSRYRFHPNTVLVLGNERAGVPADVLHLVDDCVEIPQFGMVRSLNVHVTGSIVLWEGRKQLSRL